MGRAPWDRSVRRFGLDRERVLAIAAQDPIYIVHTTTPGPAQDHNAMMAWATVLYNATPRALGPQDLNRNRIQVAEALVGAWIEAGRPAVRL